MSNSTPPGWYPDPQRGPDGGPPQERYWDGGGWSAQTRPPTAPPRWDAGGPAAPPVQRPVVSDASPAYGHPAVPAPIEPPGYGFPPPPPTPAAYGFPPPPPPAYPPLGPPAYPAAAPYGGPYLPPQPQPARRQTGVIVGVLAGALLLVGGTVVGAAALLSASGSSAGAPAPVAAAPQPAQPSAQPSPRPSDQLPPQGKAPVSPDGSTVTDTTHGWTVPLPTGWNSVDHPASSALLMTATPYDCSTPGGCVRGSFAVDSLPTQGADAQSVAQATMANYAPQLYGTLASHQELASAPITAAGLTGYAVRWHVVPTAGAKGYLLLVALPLPGGGFSILVGSVDDDPSAPQPAVLEQIVAGIRVAAPANSV